MHANANHLAIKADREQIYILVVHITIYRSYKQEVSCRDQENEQQLVWQRLAVGSQAARVRSLGSLYHTPLCPILINSIDNQPGQRFHFFFMS
jgi:hypothetical protein